MASTTLNFERAAGAASHVNWDLVDNGTDYAEHKAYVGHFYGNGGDIIHGPDGASPAFVDAQASLHGLTLIFSEI